MPEFLPPDEMSLEQAGTALTQRLSVVVRDERRTDRTFYDTFDGLLHGAGKSCVHEEGRLRLIEGETGEEIVSVHASLPTDPVCARDVEKSTMQAALESVIDVRALLPLVRVHTRTRAMSLLDDMEKTVVRLSLESPRLVRNGSAETPLRPRLRLAAVRGYDSELRKLSRCLEDDLGFRPADQSLVDEAVRAAGRLPGGISSKIDVALQPGERSDVAAVKVLQRLLEVIEANFDGTVADIDSEFLHDFRVAVRRTRSVQREFKGVFPAEELRRLRDGFRWLQRVTGDSRDLDVYVLEFDDYRALVPQDVRADLDPLLRVLEQHRTQARRVMASTLRSERCRNLRDEWAALLDELPTLSTADRPDARRPVADLAGERTRKVYHRMIRMGRAIDSSSPPEHFHELRKKGKELRYLLELFGAPLYPEATVKPMIKSLKALQDVLGRHQDREVQTAMLASLRDEVAQMPGGPAALMAMGVLVQRLREDEQASRNEFAEQFDAFAAKSRRSAVKETFG